jgi:ribosomal protein S7
MPKSPALDSSSLTAIKKRNVILNTIQNHLLKNGKTQIANSQISYENVSAIYFQRGKNIIA